MANKTVILGKISGVHGIQGWLKVFAYTQPAENIFQYKRWRLLNDSGEADIRTVEEYKQHGKKLLVKLEGVDDRDAAEQLRGLDISINRNELPELKNEYYWRDLVGLTVKDIRGVELGTVIDLIETGSNDVLLLKDDVGKSMAIPWLPEVVIEVDTKQSLLIADWEPL